MTDQPFRIELPMLPEYGPVNAYLFTSPEVVLIDTGPPSPEAWIGLAEGLAAHGVAVEDIARVIITHPHYDHYAQAGRIAAASNAQVWIADLGSPWLLEADACRERRIAYYRDEFLPRTGLPTAETRRTLAGMRKMYVSVTPVPPDRVQTFSTGSALSLGDALWTVLHTPGHNSAQTCFYQTDSQLLLASDMLLPVTPTPVVDAPPQGAPREPALPLYLDSLARVEALEVARVYPGHGAPFEDHRALIRSQRERMERRKQECLDHIRAGRHTIAALYTAMYGSRDPVRVGMAAVWMLVGYTDLLLAEHRITVEIVDETWYFHAAV